jgi:hypothetical protein
MIARSHIVRTICLAAAGLVFGLPAMAPAQAVFPISQGRMVFHRYTSFSNYDGQLYIFDFAARTLSNISAPWAIDNCTNAHFSPDGSRIVFMGVPKGQHSSSAWDIYLWQVGSAQPPVNLTEGDGVLDQDPKFFPDGKHVAFKHAGDIGVIDIETKQMAILTTGGAFSARSMEYPTADGRKILYVEGDGAGSTIYLFDTTARTSTPLITDPFQNYYPIVRDDTSFLYARWASGTNKADDIYMANFAGVSSAAAFDVPGFDDSDPYPVDSLLVLFSSDRSGTLGGYDMYVGNLRTGQARSLTLFGVVNTSLHELGACYTPTAAPTSVGDVRPETLPERPTLGVYPNPCNPSTTMEFRIKNSEFLILKVYDLLGREVAVLVDGPVEAGEHRVSWDARQSPSGVYICRLASGHYSLAERIVLIH